MDTSSTGYVSSAQIDPSTSVSGTSCPRWLLEYDASLHMTPDATSLTCCRPHPHTRVRIADDTPLHVSSIGHFTTNSFSVPSIFHVPRLSMNLMSVSQLTDFDCQVIFDRTSCRVQDRSGVMIRVVRHHSGVYALESLCLLSFPAACLHCHATVLDFHQ